MKVPPIIKDMPRLLHGGDYNPEQWAHDRSIWREDMRLAKLAHINTLSVGIFSWAALEPADGQYDFAWMDDVMGMLAENGIKAVLATPSGARPPWLAQKYPSVLRTDPNGLKRQYGGRHNHCPTSSDYRRKVAEINGLLAERYQNHPALGLWHVSNEYSGECHCELCREAFRLWLQTRYNSLEELNLAWWNAFWSHTYTDWSQIEPPSPLGESENHGLILDWKRFVTHQTVDFLKAEMEPLRRITPDVPCTTNFMEFFDGLDYAALAKELDVVSWDSYPAWRSDEQDAAVACRTAMAHDMIRGLKGGRPFLLMESTPSATNWQTVTKLKRPGLHRLASLQAVAHGSDSVQYFQFRKSRGSFEKFHGAVVDHEGSENTRVFREVAETGALLTGLDEIVGTMRESRVALIYDVENRWALDGCKGFRAKKDYLQTVLDHYAPFWKMGVPVDVIDSTMDFSGYKLLIAPMLYMLRPGVAERIDSFVKAGGAFVATYLSGYVDDHDLCFLGGFPGPLKEVLGVWAEEMDSLYDEERKQVTWRGQEYLARHFCEVVHLRGASAEGVFDEDFYQGLPAVTEHKHGLGRTWYLAARMDDDFLMDFTAHLLAELGIEKTLQTKLPEGCTAQVRTDDKTEYVFLMNFMPYEQQIDVCQGGVSMVTGEPLEGKITLAARGLEILKRPSCPE